MSEYSEDLQIHPSELVEDWVKQPNLYEKYSTLSAQALEKRNHAKRKLEVAKSDASNNIRTYPEDYGYKGKPTDSFVKEMVPLQDDVREATDELNNAEYELSILQGVVRAMEHKREALACITKLFLSGYYAEDMSVALMADEELEEKLKSLKDDY